MLSSVTKQGCLNLRGRVILHVRQQVVQLDLQREFHRAREKTAALYSMPQLPVLSTTAPARVDLATFVRRSSPPTVPSNYSSPSWKIRIATNFADSHSGFSTSTTNSITSPEDECTLAGQSAVIRPEGVFDHNRH